MTLKIEINMDNAAFESCNGFEVARVLRELSTDVEELYFEAGFAKGLYDLNGNKVGKAEVLP